MYYPSICFIIPTFNREEILNRCIEGLLNNIRYSGTFSILVGNDGDPLLSPEALYKTTVVEGPKRGYGANVNSLLRRAFNSGHYLFFQMDDDHILTKPLNLDFHAITLETDSTAGCIRLMGIAGHRYEARLEQMYWRLKWDAPELYMASNRPHLKHKRFHDSYGMYPENLKLGQTEEHFCHMCIDIARYRGGPDILVPLDTITESSWEHIGESWQAKGL